MFDHRQAMIDIVYNEGEHALDFFFLICEIPWIL
jgi:hypothetical protein